MGTFSASLRTIGDVSSLPATVQLEDGHLSIAAGSTEIGTWPLAEIHLEPIPTGYRMAAEGEQILIELKDLSSFQEALDNGNAKKRRLRMPKKSDSKATAPAPEPEAAPRPEPAPVTATANHVDTSPKQRQVALPPREETSAPTKTKPKSKPKTNANKSGFTEKGLAFVDGTLQRANKRFGPYLPQWVFTRVMFGVAFVALILMIIFPTLVSVFLLIAGALLVVFGAIVYSDPMLASRWLPGRSQPPHVLLFGVTILMMGVLLGVIAR